MKQPTIDELFATRRWCYFIPRNGFVQGEGYRVSIVFEGESGHFPTGTDTKAPWFWGTSYREAEEFCAEQNQRNGLDVGDVVAILRSAGVL